MRADSIAGRLAVGSGTPLAFLPKAIRVPERPLRAIAVGWLVAFSFSLLLSFIVGLLLPQAAQPDFDLRGAAAIIGLVIVAPAVETIVMGAVLLVLLLFLPPATAVLVSATGWAIAHSLITPVWGLVIWWPFLVFSTLFVAWRGRSLALAFLVPACAHALQNLVPAIIVAQGVTGQSS